MEEEGGDERARWWRGWRDADMWSGWRKMNICEGRVSITSMRVEAGWSQVGKLEEQDRGGIWNRVERGRRQESYASTCSKGCRSIWFRRRSLSLNVCR